MLKENYYKLKQFYDTLLIVFFLMILFVVDHFITSYNILSCPLYTIIGVPCPICGSTRASYSLLELDLKSAFMYNPAIFLIYTVILLFIVNTIYHKQLIRKIIIFLGVIILIIYCINMFVQFPNGEVINYNSDSYLNKFTDLFR